MAVMKISENFLIKSIIRKLEALQVINFFTKMDFDTDILTRIVQDFKKAISR